MYEMLTETCHQDETPVTKAVIKPAAKPVAKAAVKAPEPESSSEEEESSDEEVCCNVSGSWPAKS